MKYLSALSLLLGVMLTSVSGSASAADVTKKEVKTVKLLTIGNSFSRDATWFLQSIVEAGGHKLVHDSIVVGGASLELHATKAQKYEEDPKNPEGLYSDGKSLKEHLLSDQWDVVTIQQASIKSHNIDTYRPFAKYLYDYVKKHAPKAKIMFHQTWAYRVDDPRFSPKNTKPGEPLTQKAMYEQLRNAYFTMAAELGVDVIPVGDAMFAADSDPQWGYKPDKSFDFANAKQPELPDQTHSLHTGWRWAKGKNDNVVKLSMDGHHASPAGQYLGGCVFYAKLFDEDVTANPFKLKGMSDEDAAFLRRKAQQAVLGLSLKANYE